MDNFQCFALPEALLRSLEGMKYTTPTPIQAQAIPLALEGKDVLGSAETGSGKTAAFVLPLIAYVMAAPENTALVLTPTRELAVQVIGIVRQLLLGQKNIQAALLIGGEAMQRQLTQLRARPRIIVGTPGRINDHLKRRTLSLNNAGFLVLDETDRMLDMGFGIQIDTILQHVPKQRQTLMFSATLPKEIMKLSAKYLNNPVRVSVGNLNKPSINIRQDVAHLSESEKHPRLIKELEERQGSVIIFVKTKRGADRLAKKLRELKHTAEAIHGDLRQGQRDRVIREFRADKYRILVATDVAARGLDIPHIRHVINFDLPNPSDYVHRIGRTARAGEEGSALSLVSPDDNSKWRAISKMLSTGEVSAEENNSRGGSSSKSSGNRERNYGPRRDNNRKPFGRNGGQGGFGGRRSDNDHKPYRDDNNEGRKFFRKDNENSSSESGNSEGGRSFFRKDNRSNERRQSEGNFEGRRFQRDGERRPSEGNSEGRRFSRDGERRDRRPTDGNSEGRKFFRDGNRSDRKPSESGSEGRRFHRDGERNDRRSSESSNAGGRHFFRKDSENGPKRSSDGNSEGGRRFPRDGERNERRSSEGNSEGRSFFRKDGGDDRRPGAKRGGPRKGGFGFKFGNSRKTASNY